MQRIHCLCSTVSHNSLNQHVLRVSTSNCQRICGCTASLEHKTTSGAGGKLVMLLEGGYSMQGLSEGVCESFAALLGRPSIHPHDPEVPSEPLQAAQLALDDVTTLHGLAK